MHKARALVRGSKVRVVAPASPFDRPRFERGLRRLEELGLQADLSPHLHDSTHYLAGEDADRAQDLVEALEDPRVDAIWCARGGYGSTRLLHRLSSVQPSHPKLLVGFSDISALIALWFSRYDMSAIHGPVITSLADEPAHSVTHLWHVLSGQIAGTRLSLSDTAGAEGVQGTLYATNLSLLAHLIGTPYLPDLGKCILAVEDVGERPYRLDRLWTQIRQAGVLAGVEAVVLGDFRGCDEADGSILASDALARALDGVTIPVVRGLAIGHGAPNLALPVGVRARIESDALLFLEDSVIPGETVV